MFEKETSIMLPQTPIIVKHGMQKSIQIVGDTPETLMTILQIDGFIVKINGD
jgi:hypothetical protein